MPSKVVAGQRVDVRPDRVDFRDLEYRAALRALPDCYPNLDDIESYIRIYCDDHRMVLDQGSEGACTGFALAAVINFLRWEMLARSATAAKFEPPPKVSQRMLYHNAQLYDEWEGEDYEGSSCRGAMKGWHKHGVCRGELWPYESGKFVSPQDGWDTDAAKIVLGAYYRINSKSLVDMQAAIHEVHAIYCSAEVHDGWELTSENSLEGATIRPRPKRGSTGGHAFALVGYTPDGFIVQNSWGGKWGYRGFAVVPYGDWLAHGYDAWAMTLGAPLNHVASPRGRSVLSLQESHRVPAGWFFNERGKTVPDLPKGIDPWSADNINGHALVSTIAGAPVRHLQEAQNGPDAVRIVVEKALAECQDGGKPLALYVHGGLNGQDAGLLRAGFMGPWFEANGIVPLFCIWQTDAQNSILHGLAELIGLDGFLADILSRGPADRPDDNAVDRRVEELARKSPGKMAWTEMKNKANCLSQDLGVLHLALRQIADLTPARRPQLHLVGHSAGAIVIGHLLAAMEKLKLQVGTVTLYAPACTAAFANEYYGRALESKTLPKGQLHIDYLSDRREQLDACIRKLGVTLYSKSLLYLVSRAFENVHKTPILGLEHTVTGTRKELEKLDVYPRVHPDFIAEVEAWQALAKAWNVSSKPSDANEVFVYRGKGKRKRKLTPNTHGAFDNDIDCVSATIGRILGDKPPVPVDDLDFGGS